MAGVVSEFQEHPQELLEQRNRWNEDKEVRILSETFFSWEAPAGFRMEMLLGGCSETTEWGVTWDILPPKEAQKHFLRSN